MARKKQVWEGVNITGIADRGKSVGRHPDGRVVFVEGAVPGDVIDALILRKKKGVYQGVVHGVRAWSSDRVKPNCDHFESCGGCKWQHLDYGAQVAHKQQIVTDVMRRIGKIPNPEIKRIIPADPIYHYRNKMEFSFSNQKWKTKEEIARGEMINQEGALGLHPPGFFNKVVEIRQCWLQDPRADEIRNYVRRYAEAQQLTYFDPIHHRGLLRNMIIRNTLHGEWMLVMSFAEERMDAIRGLMQAVVNEFPWLTSIQYVINQKKNDTIFDQEVVCFQGRDHITERLGDLIYKIRPKSFFQTNSYQAKQLYDVAKDFCNLSGHEVLYDLYTGTGSIALYLADKAREIVGIEEVPDAIRDARENAVHNNINNAHFYVGDVKHQLNSELLSRHPSPDVVVTDPPRMGMHEQVIHHILGLTPNRIVYISCNPATQARDLTLLNGQYEVIKMQPVDMFPHTNHIENVALLRRRNP